MLDVLLSPCFFLHSLAPAFISLGHPRCSTHFVSQGAKTDSCQFLPERTSPACLERVRATTLLVYEQHLSPF